MRGRWLRRTNAKRAAYQAVVDRLRGDPHRQIQMSFYANALRVHSVHSLVTAGVVFVVALRVRSLPLMAAMATLAFTELFYSIRELWRAGIADQQALEAARPDYVEVRGGTK